MTTTTTTEEDPRAEHDRLVAEFDENAAQPFWPGRRVLSEDGTHVVGHLDDPEPAWMQEATVEGDDEEEPAWMREAAEDDPDGDDEPEPDWMQEATPEGDGPEEAEQAAEPAKVVTYRAAHMRVQTARGKATEHACIDCGGQAQEWSYDHTDGEHIIADDDAHAGKAYSLKVEHYEPRCRGCHTSHDKAAARRRNEPGRPTTGWIGRRWAPEAAWDMQIGIRRIILRTDDQPLDDVLDLMRMYFTVQDEADLVTAAAWIGATHLAARGVGRSLPRLAIISPSKGSGKSQLLEVVRRLSHNGIPIGNTVSDALLPRMLQTLDNPTLCIDEADKTIRAKNTNVAAVLNSGWERGGTAWLNMKHGDDWRPEAINVFAPVAMAGIGVGLAEDTEDRTLTIRMHRNPNAPEPLDWNDTHLGVDDRLRKRLSDWADRVAGMANVKKPPMPDGIGGRDRDRWTLLFSAAEGTAQAKWREALRDRQAADYKAREAAREEAGRSPQEQLVVDIHDALKSSTADAWSTEDIVKLLRAHAPDQYGWSTATPLTAQTLGWDLHKFWGERSVRTTINGDRKRGFTRRQLQRLWDQAGVRGEDGEEVDTMLGQ